MVARGRAVSEDLDQFYATNCCRQSLRDPGEDASHKSVEVGWREYEYTWKRNRRPLGVLHVRRGATATGDNKTGRAFAYFASGKNNSSCLSNLASNVCKTCLDCLTAVDVPVRRLYSWVRMLCNFNVLVENCSCLVGMVVEEEEESLPLVVPDNMVSK